MKKILALYRKYAEVINYLIVGGLTTVVSLVVYYGLTFTVLNPENAVQLQAATILSWIAAVTFAYVTNRKYVFHSSNPVRTEIVSFFAARVGTLVMEMVFMFLTVTVLHMNDRVAKILAQVLIVIANYVLSKLFVFKK